MIVYQFLKHYTNTFEVTVIVENFGEETKNFILNKRDAEIRKTSQIVDA